MTDKIFSFIKKYNMISKGDTVICGLSGGADSISLLVVLTEISRKTGFTVKALHVNHCLRGSESDGDENFCREVCRKMNIPFTAVSCDVTAFARKNGLSTEESARILRYRIFAENSAGAKIATAHNANDNLETVIFNLTRGTALKGISGIPPVRDNIIRPLLVVSRREIEEYLRKTGQDYVTDSTNLSDDYTRNRIRHQILPVLAEINPSLIETSVNSIDAIRTENSLIEELTENALRECRDGNKLRGLNGFHEVIRKRCIARILSDNRLSYSYDRLLKLDDILVNGGKFNVSGDVFFVSDCHTAELKKIPPAQQPDLISVGLETGDNSIFSDKILSCEILSREDLRKISSVHRKLTFYLLDYDKIIGRVILRNRRYGDRIQLKGRKFTSSVKKLINERIPVEKRETLHFLEDDNGTVFAESLGIAERVTPDENTVKFMKISVKEK